MYKLIIKLEQQTPYISFKKENWGLRITELKPKLDRFLKEKNQKLKEDKKFWIGFSKGQNENAALDYKVRFNELRKPDVKPIEKDEKNNKEKNNYDSFFAHIGNKNNEEEKKYFSIFRRDQIELEFFSFNKDMIQYIEDSIVEFFVDTNFGMRQSKGFGGYLPVGEYTIEMDGKPIEKEFKEEDYLNSKNKLYDYRFYIGKKNLKIDIAEPAEKSFKKFFSELNMFYMAMRSGDKFRKKYPLIKTYVEKKLEIQWEKDIIKNQLKKGKVNLNKDRKKIDGKEVVVKDLFGISTIETWGNDATIKKRFFEMNNEMNKEIDRMQSPLIFKIFNCKKENSYEICFRFNEIKKEFFGKNVEVEIEKNDKVDKKLNFKTIESFDFHDFMSWIKTTGINEPVLENKKLKRYYENIKRIEKGGDQI